MKDSIGETAKYFYKAIPCSGKVFGLQCEQCGEPAAWELLYQYYGDVDREDRYLCNLHWNEENLK